MENISTPTTVAEYLSQYPYNSWSPLLCYQLNSWAHTSLGAEFVISCIRKIAGFPASDTIARCTPRDVETAMNSLGVSTSLLLSELDKWAKELSIPPEKFWATYGGEIPLPYFEAPIIYRDEIETLCRRDLVLDLSHRFDFDDLEYRIVTPDILPLLKSHAPSKNLQWITQRRDCDDHCRILRGWLSTLGYGNLAVGDSRIQCVDSNGYSVALHAITPFIFEDSFGNRSAEIFEPADGTHRPRDYAIGGGVSNRFTRTTF